MKRGLQGRWVNQSTSVEPFRAFVPHRLPPDPPLELDLPLLDLLGKADRALGQLSAVSSLVPDLPLFLYFYVRKEAVLSSQIEGTQSSIADLLLYESDEIPGVPLSDVEEVSRYVAALQHGLTRLRGGFPLSSRLIREIHGVLLSGGRGSERDPGEFRRSQNWIGGTRPGRGVFVPPPPEEVAGCIGELETFIHGKGESLPVLVEAGLVHLQFETIHPFLDGNGRIGRLLVPLLLHSRGALEEPLLYLSLYFKTHRQRYYDLLQQVREDGDWEEWLRFFLEGVRITSEEAKRTASQLLAVVARDRQRIEELGRAAGTSLRVLELLKERPLLNIRQVAERLRISFPTAQAALERLLDLGIVEELTGRRRGRLFVYTEYLALLSQGDEPFRHPSPAAN